MAPAFQRIPPLSFADMPQMRYTHPAERAIDRQHLLVIAPDRDDLLGDKTVTIDEIRQSLKLHPGSASWLTKTCSYPKPADISIITPRHNQRSMSVCSLTPVQATRRIDDDEITEGLENVPRYLSSSDELISPRPLGPTHLIICYEGSPHSEKSSPHQEIAVACPINDLLFKLNAPNCIDLLPPRLPTELVKFQMQVKHLETFPELLVYLHTKNQAKLFRELLEEWIRDILHPLPVVDGENAPVHAAISIPVACLPTPHARHTPCSIFTNRARQLVESLTASVQSVFTPGYSHLPPFAEHVLKPRLQTQFYARTVNSIAQELANEADSSILAKALSTMSCLKENVDNVGYYGKELMTELDLTMRILARAVTVRGSPADPNALLVQ